MPVTMMDVRVMRMLVRQSVVPMPVGVWLATVPGKVVHVLVMLVVVVTMSMVERLVRVLVLMPLAHVQPNANCH